MTTTADLGDVIDALRANERFLVTSHESPDGDALGSLLAMHLALVELGKDSAMVMVGDAPLPAEYALLDLVGAGLVSAVPDDLANRVLIAVDCAQATRLTDAHLLEAPVVLNIDHHHDNSRFGSANLVVDGASSTAEVLADVFSELGVSLTPAIADALYTGLVTDTGRFQYTNTTPKSLELAAELLEAGADAQRIFQSVYESMPFPKMKLLARALERAVLYANGRVVISHIVREDFDEIGALEPYSEGIIDVLRGVEGAELAALIREPPRDSGPLRKVSLRSSSERIDVSAIARKSNGGGHRRAAGFSSDLSLDDVIAFILREYAALEAPSA